MSQSDLKIPTLELETKLWTYPEGRSQGCIFLSYQGEDMTPEDPVELMNNDERFLVFRVRGSEEVRFFNKSAIMRMEYAVLGNQVATHSGSIECAFSMSDGSLVRASLQEVLAHQDQRLFDFLNRSAEPFVKVHLEAGGMCLLNKKFILHVAQLG